jgi:hypothetical protein
MRWARFGRLWNFHATPTPSPVDVPERIAALRKAGAPDFTEHPVWANVWMGVHRAVAALDLLRHRPA